MKSLSSCESGAMECDKASLGGKGVWTGLQSLQYFTVTHRFQSELSSSEQFQLVPSRFRSELLGFCFRAEWQVQEGVGDGEEPAETRNTAHMGRVSALQAETQPTSKTNPCGCIFGVG